MKRLTFALALCLSAAPALAAPDTGQVCQLEVATTPVSVQDFRDKVSQLCQPGDTLALVIANNSTPAFFIAEYCDLGRQIYTLAFPLSSGGSVWNVVCSVAAGKPVRQVKP
jgi:hypothetical protein